MGIMLREALNWASSCLKKAKIAAPRFEAELLMAHLLEVDRLHLYLKLESALSKKEWESYRSLVQRRSLHEPFAYIAGEKEFCGFCFMVNKSVLIPRPETELLVEAAVSWVKKSFARGKGVRLLEHGTGSGAVAVSLALLLPEAQIWATEISADALKVAESNARRHAVEERVTFFHGNFWQNLPEDLLYDAVITNPPYIPRQELSKLSPGVRCYEPRLALDGGDDGLDAYRSILRGLPEKLIAGGLFAVEMGWSQRVSLEAFLWSSGAFSRLEVLRDYAGHERILLAYRG